MSSQTALAGAALGAAERLEVSAVIPTRDAYPMVVDAVDSVLAQTLPAAEVVVVDDGSSDGTPEILAERYAGRPEVRVLRGTFGSAAAARNAGWRAARSPWIGFLDADDVWFPEKLATASTTLDACRSAGWFFSDGRFVPLDGGDEWASWWSAYADVPERYVGHPVAELMEVNFVLTSSVVARRDLLETLGGFDERMSHAEDLDLWIRLARRSAVAASCQPLVRYQHRPGGLTRQTERRLLGDVELFRRLARDPALSPRVRRRARHREALAQYKLAFGALRQGRRRDLWSRLPAAWMVPERVLPVMGLALAGLMPEWGLDVLKKRRWVTRGLARRALRLSRVTLRSEPAVAPVAPAEIR
jgi:glycosyltransferase involved in cell wall biosynthesis